MTSQDTIKEIEDEMILEVETVRTCLELFIKKLETEKMTSLPQDAELSDLNIGKMESVADILYMRYITEQQFSAPSNTVVTFAYRQLMKVIKNYYRMYNKKRAILDKKLADERRRMQQVVGGDNKMEEISVDSDEVRGAEGTGGGEGGWRIW